MIPEIESTISESYLSANAFSPRWARLVVIREAEYRGNCGVLQGGSPHSKHVRFIVFLLEMATANPTGFQVFQIGVLPKLRVFDSPQPLFTSLQTSDRQMMETYYLSFPGFGCTSRYNAI